MTFLFLHFGQLYIEGLCHGNFLEEEAVSLSNIFKDNFSVQPLPLGMRHYERVICLPPGANLVRDVSVKNKLERNSVLEVMMNQIYSLVLWSLTPIYHC